jgi:cerevisin
MKVVALPAFLYVALFTTCSVASPVSSADIPSNFVLAPIHTPPPPPTPAGVVATESHIISDSYLIVLQDHLEEHEIDRHHAHVHALHQHDQKLRLMTSESASTPEVSPLEGLVHKFNIGRKANKAARKALKGYSGKFSSTTLDRIRAMKDVKYVERDSLVWASEIERGAPWVRSAFHLLYSQLDLVADP